MIGLQQIRDGAEAVKAAVNRKGGGAEPLAAIDRILAADGRRRAVEAEVNDLRARRNAGNKELGALMRDGRRDEGERLKAEMAELSTRIDALTAQLGAADAAMQADLLLVPNLPHPSVPDGRSDADNPVVRTWGDPRRDDGTPPHWEIAERLRLFDLERGAKIAGSGFILYTGAGARLQRALIGLMLEMAELHGYSEVMPPLL